MILSFFVIDLKLWEFYTCSWICADTNKLYGNFEMM